MLHTCNHLFSLQVSQEIRHITEKAQQGKFAPSKIQTLWSLKSSSRVRKWNCETLGKEEGRQVPRQMLCEHIRPSRWLPRILKHGILGPYPIPSFDASFPVFPTVGPTRRALLDISGRDLVTCQAWKSRWDSCQSLLHICAKPTPFALDKGKPSQLLWFTAFYKLSLKYKISG